MFTAVCSFVVAACLGATPEAPFGYLWTYKADDHGQTCREVLAYQPREGDLLFFDDQSKFWERLYRLAGTGPPFHTGIVVKKPDGSFAVLEGGPDDKLHVFILDLAPRLHTFKGVLQVRRCKVPLTPGQSARLTAFALAQEGKGYAVGRLLLQGTPIKTRGALFRPLAKTRFDRRRWLCTEIVVAAAEVVGLMDPKVIKATSAYPLDLLDERLYDLLPAFHEAGYWAPHP